MFSKRSVAALFAVALVAALAPAPTMAQSMQTTDHFWVTSRADGTQIRATVHKPAGATADNPVPVILHSHGWGGSRLRDASLFSAYLNAGMAVVSFDQRGFGESGDQAHVQDPTRETEDVKSIIDAIATMPWVLKDVDAEGNPIANDPVLGAIGGSYGGGYQTMTALDEIADQGRTRFNALAPEITWFDLNESLAPQGVVRSAWASALYAAGARALPQYVHEAFAWGSATGQWPDGTLYGESAPGVPDLDSEFHKHGPVYFAERGVRIDVPVLLRQGASDNLFNLNEGLHIFQRAVTPAARAQSFFVGYNGGHALPNAVPAGTAGGGDACSGNWTALTINFFMLAFADMSTDGLLPARYNFTNVDGSGCIRAEGIAYPHVLPVASVGGTVATPTGAGAPIHLPIAQGPITVTGIPKMSGSATSAVLDARAFFGLSMGETPATALVIQNNLMPLRRAQPVIGEEFDIELPGISAHIPEGQTLYLTISPISDTSFGHGSRTPGGFVLEDLKVRLPAPGPAENFGGPVDPDERDDKDCGPPDGQGNGQGSEKCGPKDEDDKDCGPPDGQGNGQGSEKCGPKDDKDCGPPDEQGNGQGSEKCGPKDEDDDEESVPHAWRLRALR